MTKNITLRRWQKEALLEWKKTNNGIVKVVTAAGKTIFAIECIKDAIKKNDLNVLILVPTINLVNQWKEELYEFLEIDFAVNGGASIINGQNQFMISTNASLKKIYKNIDHKNTFLISDECHRLGTDKMNQMLQGKWKYTLGLSATPEREFDDNFEEIIQPILGRIIYEYNYSNAYRDEIITKFELINVYAPMFEHEEEEYEEISNKISKRIAMLGQFDKTDKALQALFFKRARIVKDSLTRIPAGIKCIQQDSKLKWLVFTESIKQANKFNKILKKNKFRSDVYHSGISKIQSTMNLKDFKEFDIDILVTCKSLDEGFDYSFIDAGLILSGSSSTRQRIQRMGRILRLAKDKNIGKIYSIYCSDDEEKRLKDEMLNFDEKDTKVKWIKFKVNA